MKLNKKSLIIGFFAGIIMMMGTGVLAAYFSASQISFTPNDSNWKVDNVDEAVSYLYEINDPSDYTVTKLYSTVGQSGGKMNVNYTTLSYTLTEEDINNDYKFYILDFVVNGGNDDSYRTVSSLNIPENAIEVSNYDVTYTPANVSRHEQHLNKTYIIPKQDVGTVISCTLRGVYSFSLTGIK